MLGRGNIARRKRPAAITIGCDLDPDAINDGRDVATMFHCDGVQWVTDYFGLPLTLDSASRSGTPNCASCDRESRALDADGSRSTVATFGGFPWARHFVYFDPPYFGCGLQYYTWFRRWIESHELDEEAWHRVLCRLFMRLPCPAALSGYHSDVYDAELRDARAIEIPTVNRAGKKCVEVLWMNYDEPTRYHDTRFIGNGRRGRERIRRRVKNWRDGIARMTQIERQAVWEACDAAFRDAAGINGEGKNES